MPVAREILERDPVFQLNLLLWALITVPSRAPIDSFLRTSGYVIHAISPSLPPHPSIRRDVFEQLGGGSPRPDLVVEAPPTEPWLVFENKAASFSVDSDNCVQAKKLLVVSNLIHSSLSLPEALPPAHVIYLTPAHCMAPMSDTLIALRSKLTDSGLPAANASSIGVSIDSKGVVLEAHDPSSLPKRLRGILSVPRRVITVDEGTDPMPLYILPFDPTVVQDAELSARSKRQFNERILAASIRLIGQAIVPNRISLVIDNLVSQATLSASNCWRDRDATLQVRQHVARLISSALRPAAKDVGLSASANNQSLDLTIRDRNERQRILELLIHKDPSEMQMELF